MSNLIIMGSREHEIAAIEVLCRMHWKELTCTTHKPGLFSRSALSKPSQSTHQYIVADLLGLGMPNYTPDNAKRVFADIDGRAAILITPSDGGGWEAAKPPAGQRVIWLRKPFKSLALRDAIQELTRPDDANEATVDPDIHSSTRHPAASKSSTGRADHLASIQLLVDTFPTLRSDKATRLVQKLAATNEPVNIPVGSATWIVDYSAGWLTTSLRQSSTLLHVLRQHIAVENIDLGTWSTAEIKDFVDQLSSRLSDVRKPLASFLWDFVASTVRDLPVNTRENLHIKLDYLPNFTVIEHADPIDLHLAAICAKSPQSLHNLRVLFPDQDTEIFRFVMLTVLSGLGTISTTATDLKRNNIKRGMETVTSERRSFLRRLLDKLS